MDLRTLDRNHAINCNILNCKMKMKYTAWYVLLKINVKNDKHLTSP